MSQAPCAEEGLHDSGNGVSGPGSVHEVPGAFHGFDLLLAKAGVSRAFADTQAEALGAALRT